MKTISCSLLLLVILSPLLLAQTAQIDGTVTDSSSAVMPGVSIAATNVETGTVRSTVSNNDGYYTLPLLQPGKYNLTVKRDGFRPVIHDGLVLAVNQNVRLDIVMQVGTLTESLQVTEIGRASCRERV